MNGNVGRSLWDVYVSLCIHVRKGKEKHVVTVIYYA